MNFGGGVRLQILLLTLFPLLLTVVLLDGYFLHYRFPNMEQAMRDRAMLFAQQFAASGSLAVMAGESEPLQLKAKEALRRSDVMAVAIKDAGGKVLAYAGATLSEADSQIVNARDDTELGHETPLTFWLREPITVVTYSPDIAAPDTVRSEIHSKVLGYVLLKMGKDSLLQEKNEMLKESAMIGGVLFCLTLFFALRLSRRIIHPLKSLGDALGKFADEGMELPAQSYSGLHELKKLEQAAVDMAKRVREAQTALDKQVESLHTSEQCLRAVVDLLPVALYVKDAKQRIVLMNSACEAQWGVLFADVGGTDGSGFLPAAQLSGAAKKIEQEIFAGRQAVDFEETLWNPEINANRTLHTFRKPLYTKNGEALYMLGMSIDVSARKLFEEQLKGLGGRLTARIENPSGQSIAGEGSAASLPVTAESLAAAGYDLSQSRHALGVWMGELYAKLNSEPQLQLLAQVEQLLNALIERLDALETMQQENHPEG